LFYERLMHLGSSRERLHAGRSLIHAVIICEIKINLGKEAKPLVPK